jgi:hypothetical protein
MKTLVDNIYGIRGGVNPSRAAELRDALALGMKTVKYTIGGVGVAGCDFNVATATNTTAQPIDLGAIIPSLGRVVDIFTHTDAVWTGAVTLLATVGNVTGGNQYITSSTVYAAAVVLAEATGGAFMTAPTVAEGHVWVGLTPGANWNLVTAGKLSVYITYIDVTNL